LSVAVVIVPLSDEPDVMPAATDLNFNGSGCGPDGTGGAFSFLVTQPYIPSLHDPVLGQSLRENLAKKTMPSGALGQIETLALQLGLIQGTLKPCCDRQAIIVFAADHGIADRGVSAYPKSVTWQMVMNFLAGGAAINVFAVANNIALRIVDAGVDHDFQHNPQLIHAKIAPGTADLSRGPAMSTPQCDAAIAAGARITAEVIAETRAELLGFGEMGIGNTSSAALLCARLLQLPIEACVGRGTGLDDTALAHKRAVLREAMHLHSAALAPLDVLACLGGFEIAMMVGGMLEAARQRRVILIDGYIVTSALLLAWRLQPAVLEYCVFAHRSGEPGHSLALKALDASPLLDLGLRLGEGSGAALAMPLVKSAARMLSDMASFESAAVAGAVAAVDSKR
jgi:nicotinate-nucleotide--dimethylbenzimidazole phosphoribosyltransferase